VNREVESVFEQVSKHRMKICIRRSGWGFRDEIKSIGAEPGWTAGDFILSFHPGFDNKVSQCVVQQFQPASGQNSALGKRLARLVDCHDCNIKFRLCGYDTCQHEAEDPLHARLYRETSESYARSPQLTTAEQANMV
jgi:hypothetical protein